MQMRGIFLIGIFIILLMGIAHASDWPMFQHDLTHSGASDEVLNPPLELKRKFQSGGSIYSFPAIYIQRFD